MLTAREPQGDDHYGLSVGESASLVAVGAQYDDDGGSNSGSVYLFSAVSPYSQLQKLTASDAAASDYFGAAVAVKKIRTRGSRPSGPPG